MPARSVVRSPRAAARIAAARAWPARTGARSVPKLGRTLRSLAIVEVQHPAEPLAARNSAHIRRLTSRPLDQPVVETSVIPFHMVVLDVLGAIRSSFAGMCSLRAPGHLNRNVTLREWPSRGQDRPRERQRGLDLARSQPRVRLGCVVPCWVPPHAAACMRLQAKRRKFASLLGVLVPFAISWSPVRFRPSAP